MKHLKKESTQNTNNVNYTNFKRNINKDEIPVCNILNVDIAAINMKWLLTFLRKNIKHDNGNTLSGDYICVSNVHTTVMAYNNLEYCNIQNNALMAIPDGGPLATIGKRKGFQSMCRVPGPSLMEEIFKVSVKYGYRHYFYGSTEDTIKKVVKRLKSSYPGIDIAGHYSPPFRELTCEEIKQVQDSINKLDADFIWIGLGAPKQERWMSLNKGLIKGLMIGVGAGFDYYAGNINRAPMWMQKTNLEWLYRLFQEPRRLFKRYFYTNIQFIYLMVTKK